MLEDVDTDSYIIIAQDILKNNTEVRGPNALYSLTLNIQNDLKEIYAAFGISPVQGAKSTTYHRMTSGYS